MRKTYPQAFKIQVCQAIIAGETTVGATAKHYGIARPIVSRWLAEYQRYGQDAFTGQGKRLTDQAKLYALEQENVRLREENSILKNSGSLRKSKSHKVCFYSEGSLPSQC